MSEHETRDRFSLFRLCACVACDGAGRVLYSEADARAAGSAPPSTVTKRCPECRGEGRTRVEVATAQTPEAVGVALVTCAREGEWLDEYGDPCAFGLLDREGDVGQKWLISPWLASPRNVRDSARTLARSKRARKSS